MTDKPKRRWYQFSLLALLVGVTLLVVAMGCVLALIPIWRSLKNPLDFGGREEFELLKVRQRGGRWITPGRRLLIPKTSSS